MTRLAEGVVRQFNSRSPDRPDSKLRKNLKLDQSLKSFATKLRLFAFSRASFSAARNLDCQGFFFFIFYFFFCDAVSHWQGGESGRYRMARARGESFHC